MPLNMVVGSVPSLVTHSHHNSQQQQQTCAGEPLLMRSVFLFSNFSLYKLYSLSLWLVLMPNPAEAKDENNRSLLRYKCQHKLNANPDPPPRSTYNVRSFIPSVTVLFVVAIGSQT
jgi:hypothetical protein